MSKTPKTTLKERRIGNYQNMVETNKNFDVSNGWNGFSKSVYVDLFRLFRIKRIAKGFSDVNGIIR